MSADEIEERFWQILDDEIKTSEDTWVLDIAPATALLIENGN